MRHNRRAQEIDPIAMFADRRIRTSLFAIGADLFLTLLKTGLALLTGSAALLADAYHSGTDLVISLVLLGSLVIRYRQERRREGPGCHRARWLESALAIGVSLLILYVPVEILLDVQTPGRQPLRHLGWGMAGILVVLAVVHFMARLKTHVGRATDSPALEADGYHSKIDLFTTLAVLASFVGTMIGVHMDELVALVIALLIAVAGIELMASGIAGLRRDRELEPIPLLEPLLERVMPGRQVGDWLKEGLARARRLFWLPPLLAVLAWLGTSVHFVPVGHLGLKTALGAPVATELKPGLHVSWPRPFGNVDRVRANEVHSIEVGSRTPGGRLWRDLNAVQAGDDDTLYLVTRDENLVALRLAVHYRLQAPVEARLRFGRVAPLVARAAESALWQTTAQVRFDELLLDSHSGFTEQVTQALKNQLAGLGLAVAIVDTQLLALQPPAMVVGAYRDLLNAEQEKRQYRHRAEAQRTHDLLMARAQRVEARADTRAAAIERRYRAEGDVARFEALAGVHREHRRAVRFEQHLRAFTDTLSQPTLWLLDPTLPRDDIRLWGPAGLLQPDENP